MPVPLHKMAPGEDEIIEEEIAQLATKGFLTKAKNPRWCFPFFVATGKGMSKGKKRTVVGFLRLNSLLKVVDYPFPIIDELVHEIPAGCIRFSNIEPVLT